jgi:hypothetical protein
VGSVAKRCVRVLGVSAGGGGGLCSFERALLKVKPTQYMAFKNFRFIGASYFDIGSGLLPFSITPVNGASQQARSMLSMDRVRTDTFELGADPKSGAILPGDVV